MIERVTRRSQLPPIVDWEKDHLYTKSIPMWRLPVPVSVRYFNRVTRPDTGYTAAILTPRAQLFAVYNNDRKLFPRMFDLTAYLTSLGINVQVDAMGSPRHGINQPIFAFDANRSFTPLEEAIIGENQVPKGNIRRLIVRAWSKWSGQDAKLAKFASQSADTRPVREPINLLPDGSAHAQQTNLLPATTQDKEDWVQKYLK